MKSYYRNVQVRIREEEQKISLDSPYAIVESQKMSTLLKELLNELKEHVMVHGFADQAEEIEFFKKIKPGILGKLMFYNQVFCIETSRPVSLGNMHECYFSNELARLEQKYKDQISNSEFYRYYRSGSTKHDEEFFLRGRIDLSKGLNNHVFEFDPNFSTYYDYIISSIIENDLLYEYLLSRINNGAPKLGVLDLEAGYETIRWTESKTALIELIYALHASACIADGKIGIRKVAQLFQAVFNVQLGDVHHAFHRMKDRTGNRSIFLERMKFSLEQYMDKDLS